MHEAVEDAVGAGAAAPAVLSQQVAALRDLRARLLDGRRCCV